MVKDMGFEVGIRAPRENQEKRLTFFRQNSSIAAEADFLNLY